MVGIGIGTLLKRSTGSIDSAWIVVIVDVHVHVEWTWVLFFFRSQKSQKFVFFFARRRVTRVRRYLSKESEEYVDIYSEMKEATFSTHS